MMRHVARNTGVLFSTEAMGFAASASVLRVDLRSFDSGMAAAKVKVGNAKDRSTSGSHLLVFALDRLDERLRLRLRREFFRPSDILLLLALFWLLLLCDLGFGFGWSYIFVFYIFVLALVCNKSIVLFGWVLAKA